MGSRPKRSTAAADRFSRENGGVREEGTVFFFFCRSVFSEGERLNYPFYDRMVLPSIVTNLLTLTLKQTQPRLDEAVS